MYAKYTPRWFRATMTPRFRKLLLPVAAVAASFGAFTLAGSAAAAPATAPASAEIAVATCTKAVTVVVANTYARVPAAANGSFSCLMGQGNAGAAVRVLQIALNQCYSARLTVDGIFGGNTARALATAQSRAGVTPDGIYGPNTARAINFPLYDRSTDRYVRCMSVL
jgi:peptidoglycan hydrolase-like protein with peptidoglycan-binding domain